MSPHEDDNLDGEKDSMLDYQKSIALVETIVKKVKHEDLKRHEKKKAKTKDEIYKERRAYFMQILMACLANISVLSSGFGLAYPSITLHALEVEFPDLTSDQCSWFASITSLMCPLGGLLCSFILDKIGRKWTLIIINLISILSWGLITISSQNDVSVMYSQLMCARILIGINIGLSSMPASVYAAEISSPEIRGRLTTLVSISISMGVLIIYLLGFFMPTNWRLVALVAGFICVIALFLLIPIPESPSWLISKGKEAEAEKSLKVFRGIKPGSQCQEILDELEHLIIQTSSDNKKRGENESTITLLRQPDVYKPIIMMTIFFGFQQFSGIFVVIVYASQFSTEAAVPIDPFLCAVLVGIIRVIGTCLSAYVMDKFGRKLPSIISGAGMSICMLGLAIQNVFATTFFQALPAILLLIYIFMATIGFQSVPFAMNAEIFPRKARGLASGLTISLGYFMSFIAIKLYPVMVTNLNSSIVFGIYCVFSFLGTLFAKYILIETKGKTLEQIEQHFNGKKATSIESSAINLR